MSEINIEVLKAIKAGQETEQGYGFFSKKEYSSLVEAGLVGIDPDITNGGKGFALKVAAGLTEEGEAYLESIENPTPKPVIPDAEPTEENDLPDFLKDEEDVPALYDELLPEPEAPAPLTGFETITLDEVPKIRHKSDRAPRKSKYDFEKLPKAEFDGTGKQINVVAIFVGATDKQPNPLKSVQSSLSIVNKKYKGERHFIARKYTKDGVEGVVFIRDL
jgi:hypothetical protein